MEWVKLYAVPAYYLDPALLRAGEPAEVLFCRALAYCGGVESRGVIDKTVLPMLVPTKPQARADALVREGLWLDEGTRYRIRSWDKLQDEHDAAAERRRKDRERKREARLLSADVPADTSADCPRTPSEPDAECRALDVEGEVEKNSPSRKRDEPEGFAAFWLAYPRKIGKGHAIKAYAKALKTTTPDVLLAAASAFARERAGQDEKFTPHPSTWLNAQRWDDEAPSQQNELQAWLEAHPHINPVDEYLIPERLLR